METFIKLMTKELKNKGLTLFDKAVYSSLYTKYQYHQAPFYTYESFIADELEISENTVKRSIKKLQELGMIGITKKYSSEVRKTVNYYTILSMDNNAIKEDTVEEQPVDDNTVEQTNDSVNDYIQYIYNSETNETPTVDDIKINGEQFTSTIDTVQDEMTVIHDNDISMDDMDGFERLDKVLHDNYDTSLRFFVSTFETYKNVPQESLNKLSQQAHVSISTVKEAFSYIAH